MGFLVFKSLVNGYDLFYSIAYLSGTENSINAQSALLQKFSILFSVDTSINRKNCKIYFLSSICLNFETFYRQWSTSYLNMGDNIEQDYTQHTINQSNNQSINQFVDSNLPLGRCVSGRHACPLDRPYPHGRHR